MGGGGGEGCCWKGFAVDAGGCPKYAIVWIGVKGSYIQNEFDLLARKRTKVNIDLCIFLVIEFAHSPNIHDSVRSILIADAEEG